LAFNQQRHDFLLRYTYRRLSVQIDFYDKKAELESIKKQSIPLTADDMNSKKFFINVLETRIKRHKQYAKAMYLKAEKKIRQDRRITKYLQ
jgi:hypothetical protein